MTDESTHKRKTKTDNYSVSKDNAFTKPFGQLMTIFILIFNIFLMVRDKIIKQNDTTECQFIKSKIYL